MKKIQLFILIILFSTMKLSAQIPTIVINEFMADNVTTIADPSGSYDDWIEIYNYGDEPVDIGGMYFTDNFADTAKWQVPAGNDSTIISSKGFLLLWADNDPEEGVLHLDIKLSKNGEQIGVLMNDGSIFIDSLSFGPQSADISFGRKTDAAPNWIFFDEPTPCAPNGSSGINENGNYLFELFPNPASEFTVIKMPFKGNKTIKIFDVNGREISSLYTDLINIKLSLTKYKPGLYIVRVTSQNDQAFIKHLIIR